MKVGVHDKLYFIDAVIYVLAKDQSHKNENQIKQFNYFCKCKGLSILYFYLYYN